MTARSVVLDSSALVAILTSEADATVLIEKISRAPRRYLSAATLLETSVVIERKLGTTGIALLDDFVALMAAEIVPFDAAAVGWARRAFRKFGKGVHPAALNLGDCISYATAMHLALPLLFKGSDFGQTDVEPA